MSEKKKYGLVLKKNQPLSKSVSSTVGKYFGDDDEEETNSEKPFDPRKIEISVGSSISQKLSQATLEKAQQEDQTVCQYDEVYDEMEEQKRLADPRRSQDSKDPKYMNDLLKVAAFRKRERARRMDRKIQKEREEEGDEFADTEVYITDAYRQKLEERQEEEISLKVKEKLEEMANVQGDMSQFYRQYLLKQQESRSLGSIEPVQGIVEKAITEHPEIVESIIMESIQENEPKATSKQTDESDSATGELDESSIIEEAAPVVKKNKYEVYYHRNDEKSIEQARLRYLERKGAFIRQYLVEHVK